MNILLLSISFFLFIMLNGTYAQWFIIKKDHPSMSMNYPNPGRRSISDVDCSIPYAYLTSYEEKTAWILSCKDQNSSSSSSNSIEDESSYSPRLIPHDRRTLRSSPPFFDDRRDSFNIRLLKRLRRSMKK